MIIFVRVLGYFFALSLLAAGVGLMVDFVRSYQMGRASKSWPTAQGIITSSEVREQPDGNGGTVKTGYISYNYKVDGQTFAGDVVSAADQGGLITPTPDTVSRYPISERVNVYYDPEDPHRAMLEPGAGVKVYAKSLFSVLFVVGGVWLGFYIKRALPLARSRR